MTEQQKEDNMEEQRRQNEVDGRRKDDHRFIKLESDMREMKSENNEMWEDIVYIKTRIDNGFSTSIKSTEDKVNGIDERNTREHSELKQVVKDSKDESKSDNKHLSKKFDIIIVLIVLGTVSALLKDWILGLI